MIRAQESVPWELQHQGAVSPQKYHQMLQSVLYLWLRCKDVSVCGLTLYQNILLKIYNIQNHDFM